MADTGEAKTRSRRQRVVLDEGQYPGGGPHLQERGQLGQVGVAHDHVEATEAGGVRVGFVAGVDDRAFEGRLQPDLLLEEVGPLGELERHVPPRQAGRLGPDLAGAGVDLA